MSDKASSAGNQQGRIHSVSPNLINHKWGTLRDYTPDTVKFSDELVTLIALLYTDGGISKHHLSSWRIFFANSSEAAIELFRNCLIKIFKISPDRIKVRTTLGRYHFAVLTSKAIGSYLVGTFGHFRTLRFENGQYPSASIPVKQLTEHRKAEIFLKTAFSMDGGVKFYLVKSRKIGTKWLERNVSLACHHPTLRNQYQQLLQSIGVKSVNIEKDKVIKIRKRENLEKFAKKIGFIDGIKTTRHSKFWVGVEKNEVLRILVASYNNPSKYLRLPQFRQ